MSSPTRPCVLVLDDSTVNLKFLGLVLGREGFDVRTKSDFVGALAYVEEVKPDLVLLDIMMPGLSGLEFLAALKSSSVMEHVPVLMITALTQGSDVRTALEAGAFDYIKKPLDEIEVVARVRSALRFKAQQDKLVEMASRDSLTGLYNHHLLIDLLGRERSDSRRRGQPLTYCMVDIDHFKTVNDTYGHLEGDHVLKTVSAGLMAGVRKSDIVGRYGGEEFGLVLGACSLETAVVLCERLRHDLAGHRFGPEESPFSITLSMGLAQALPTDGFTDTELVARADRALYRAKETGRNRVVLAD